MKDIEEHLHQYLPQPGQTVYLQSVGVRNRDRKVEVTHYTEEGAVDFFNSVHGKVITSDDFEKVVENHGNDGKLGKKIGVGNGQMAIVLGSFHWGYTDKEIEELLEAEKIESADDATPSIICFLLTDDKFVLAGLNKCNVVNL